MQAYILYRKNGHRTVHHAVQQNVNSYHGHSLTIHCPVKIKQPIFFEKVRPYSGESFGYTVLCGLQAGFRL